MFYFIKSQCKKQVNFKIAVIRNAKKRRFARKQTTVSPWSGK